MLLTNGVQRTHSLCISLTSEPRYRLARCPRFIDEQPRPCEPFAWLLSSQLLQHSILRTALCGTISCYPIKLINAFPQGLVTRLACWPCCIEGTSRHFLRAGKWAGSSYSAQRQSAAFYGHIWYFCIFLGRCIVGTSSTTGNDVIGSRQWPQRNLQYLSAHAWALMPSWQAFKVEVHEVVHLSLRVPTQHLSTQRHSAICMLRHMHCMRR